MTDDTIPAHTPVREERAPRLRQELRPASAFLIHARTAGLRCASAGESHWAARHSDAVVDYVLALSAAGVPTKQIARELRIARSTVRSWCSGRRRSPPARRVNTRRPLSYELRPLVGLADLEAAHIPQPGTESPG